MRWCRQYASTISPHSCSCRAHVSALGCRLRGFAQYVGCPGERQPDAHPADLRVAPDVRVHGFEVVNGGELERHGGGSSARRHSAGRRAMDGPTQAGLAYHRLLGCACQPSGPFRMPARRTSSRLPDDCLARGFQVPVKRPTAALEPLPRHYCRGGGEPQQKTMEVEEAPSFDQHLLSSAFSTESQCAAPQPVDENKFAS